MCNVKHLLLHGFVQLGLNQLWTRTGMLKMLTFKGYKLIEKCLFLATVSTVSDVFIATLPLYPSIIVEIFF